jgi:hypothetical protein
MSAQALDSLEAGVGPSVIGTSHRAGVVKVWRVLFWGGLLALLLTTGCNPQETLFESNFEANTVNQPPSPTQKVGTATSGGDTGSVLVVAAPSNASPPTKWVRISRAPTAPGGNPASLAMFQGNMTKAPGNGKYTFSTEMYMPTGTNNVASIQFGTLNQQLGSFPGFFHLDFLQNNRIRIDDDESTVFGTFPRNKPFIVQVTLDVSDTSAKAHIVLAGDGASGQADRDVFGALRSMGQFGSVRIWMGFPWTGEFEAANVLVTRNQ